MRSPINCPFPRGPNFFALRINAFDQFEQTTSLSQHKKLKRTSGNQWIPSSRLQKRTLIRRNDKVWTSIIRQPDSRMGTFPLPRLFSSLQTPRSQPKTRNIEDGENTATFLSDFRLNFVSLEWRAAFGCYDNTEHLTPTADAEQLQ